jgi:hypothetical protein
MATKKKADVVVYQALARALAPRVASKKKAREQAPSAAPGERVPCCVRCGSECAECVHDELEGAAILALRKEAAEAGDLAMVALCDGAVDGDAAAQKAVRDAIQKAQAMEPMVALLWRPEK